MTTFPDPPHDDGDQPQPSGWLAVDWLLRTVIPLWLRMAGLRAAAAALLELGPVADRETFDDAAPLLRRIRDDTVQRWDERARGAGSAQLLVQLMFAPAVAAGLAIDAAGAVATAAATGPAGVAAAAAAAAADGAVTGAALTTAQDAYRDAYDRVSARLRAQLGGDMREVSLELFAQMQEVSL